MAPIEDEFDSENQVEKARINLTNIDIQQISHLIESNLESNNIYSTIRQLIREYIQKENPETATHDKVFDVFLENDIVQQILDSLRSSPNLLVMKENIPTTNQRYLELRVLRGGAFLEYSQYHPILKSQKNQNELKKNHYFRLLISFGNQRFQSKDVECCLEPLFDEVFQLNLQEHQQCDEETTFQSLLERKNQPIILTLLSLEKGIEEKYINLEFCSSYMLEWRRVLEQNAPLCLPIEFSKTLQEEQTNLPIGILHISLNLHPELSTEEIVPISTITKQLQYETLEQSEGNRSFFHYAKSWWKEYTQISPLLKDRMVKIFAVDERNTTRSVCSYVVPIIAERVVDTPYHAARFVGLIPNRKIETIGIGREERWNSLETFLGLGYGDCYDHANFLVSLFLGFGMDAYVCIGAIQQEEMHVPTCHSWVMTRYSINGKTKITFWETMNGQRFHLSSEEQLSNDCQYKAIGCIYNHESFYANKQVDDRISSCSFELEDEKLWKSMDKSVLKKISKQLSVGLIPPELPVIEKENKIETELRQEISVFRQNLGLRTNWDYAMDYYLKPALSSYEMERCFGTTFSNEEFHSTIERKILEGHTFKAFPRLFTTNSVKNIFKTLEQNSIAGEILRTTGDKVKLSLCIKIFSYPERTFALWIMLSANYQPFIKEK